MVDSDLLEIIEVEPHAVVITGFAGHPLGVVRAWRHQVSGWVGIVDVPMPQGGTIEMRLRPEWLEPAPEDRGAAW